MILGCHVQMKAPDYLEGSIREALSYDANALMLYTGAPQNTRRKPVAELRAQEARQLMKESGIPMEHMIIHAPYIINPANSVKAEVAELAREFLYTEMQRTSEIGARYLVLHPGSYTTADLETGILTAAGCLNSIDDYPEEVVVCLETMAGKGSEIGFRFEQIAELLSRLNRPDSFGVCLDTCHISDAGYDMDDFDGILDEFDRIIGLDRLFAVHLNDSLNPRGSHKDRHAKIGEGQIGLEALVRVINHPQLRTLPFILETPNDHDGYAKEIALLRSHFTKADGKK